MWHKVAEKGVFSLEKKKEVYNNHDHYPSYIALQIYRYKSKFIFCNWLNAVYQEKTCTQFDRQYLRQDIFFDRLMFMRAVTVILELFIHNYLLSYKNLNCFYLLLSSYKLFLVYHSRQYRKFSGILKKTGKKRLLIV